MSEHLTSILRVRECEERACDSSEDEVELSFAADGKTVSLKPAPPTSERFVFDEVYAANEGDETVYKSALKKTVDSTLLGYNGTLIFLEVGAGGSQSSLRNMISLAANQIFLCLNKSKSSRSAANLVVNCSYVAVAGERAYDLLRDTRDGGTECVPLSIGDDRLPHGSVREVKSMPQALGLLKQGGENEESLVEWLRSPSSDSDAAADYHHHTILSLTVEYSHFGSMNAPVSGTLSFARLSSPRPLAHREQYSKESQLDQHVISLLALSEVVDTLSSCEGSEMAPQAVDSLYSKSLLTQLLRESLGGNCKTVFMCDVVKPVPVSHLREVGVALRLASRARQVQNRPNKRDLAERALMSAYMTQLKKQYSMQDTAASDGRGSEEESRQHAMELAASALAQAVGGSGGPGHYDGESGDGEEEDGSHPTHSQTKKISVVTSQAKKLTDKTLGHGSDSRDTTSASEVTIDALVGVLQDPDRGVPRALEARLKDVKIRRDVGALFSGAGIVQWMLENVEGVRSESDAVTLGQLLLDEGAIFHSEGSMIFANADSLFYYAREPRLGRRLLSPEQIQALLSHVREPDNITSTPVVVAGKRAQESHQSQDADDDEDAQSFGFKTSPTLEDCAQFDAGVLALQASGGFEPSSSALGSDSWSPYSNDTASDSVFQYTTDHNGTCGGVGEEPTDRRVSVESWIAEEKEVTGEEEEEEEGNPNIILQQSLPSIHTLENSRDYPHPLHMTVAVGNQPGVIRHLVMMFGVDQTDTRGRTPLMFAALGNKRASCSTLVECGAVCDKQDESGLTALHVACYHGSKEAARVLLNKKASVTITDKMGHTALHWSVIPESTACLQLLLHYMWPEGLKQADSSGLTAMHWAIFYNHPHHLKLLLKKCSGEAVIDTSGRTLLTYAIERDPPTEECITVLLETSPQLLTERDANGRLPLHMASIATSPVPLSLLLATSTTRLPHRSSVQLDINCVDSSLRTPLHYASAANNIESVKVLLLAGAHQLSVDSEGKTPLDYATLLEEGAALVELLQQPPLSPTSTTTIRPVTVGNITSPSKLHSSSTHSLPTQLEGPADPSKVCTIL